MERSAIRGSINARGFPDFAALHPGYENRRVMLSTARLRSFMVRLVFREVNHSVACWWRISAFSMTRSPDGAKRNPGS
jgi:hypothetical protein